MTIDQTGKVTAKAVGVATVTATCESYSATCSIEVINSSIPDTREDLPSGKNKDVLNNRGQWYRAEMDTKGTDTTGKVINYCKKDDKENIFVSVFNNKKTNGTAMYGYLRYAPQDGKYEASYTITYSGNEECSVSITGGTNEEKKVVLSKDVIETGTYIFEIKNDKPFQLKFNALGDYEFHVTFAPAAGE